MRQSRFSFLSTCGLVLVLIGGPCLLAEAAGISIRLGGSQRNRLEGRRFDTMRTLAHYLDEAALSAAREVNEVSWPGRDPRVERSIEAFARDVDSFHARMDAYGSSPWDVANDVTALDQRARRIDWQIRNTRGYRRAFDDWAEVRRILGLMSRNVQGYDVDLPSQYRSGYRPYDGRSRYADGRHQEFEPNDGDRRDQRPDERDRVVVDESGARDNDGPFVTGPPLQEFRRLADSLDAQTSRVLSATQGAGPEGQLDADLRDFARQAADLNRRTDAGRLDTREVGPIVARLLDDARRTDVHLRRSHAYARVLPDWQASIRLLEQMASIVRS